MRRCNVGEIIRLYCEELLSVAEVGRIVGVNRHTVSSVLKENDIQIRVPTDSPTKVYDKDNPRKEIVEDVDKLKELFYECKPVLYIADELGIGRRAVERAIKELNLIRPKSMMSREQYDDSKDKDIIELYNSGKSPEEIGKIVGLSRCGVKNHLKRNDITIRNSSEAFFAKNGKEFPNELKNYEDLYDLYVVQRLSKKEIGKMFNIAPHVVDRVLKHFNIHVRDCSESKFGLCAGEKHPNWKGGVTGLYGLLRVYFKIRQNKFVLKRDGNKCKLCGSKKKLQVHHIRHFSDIFKEILSEHTDLSVAENKEELYNIMINDERFNDLDNLTTYCKECHLFKVHGYKKHTN